MPEEGEVLGQVIQKLGGAYLLVRCTDGYTRKVRIPGKYKKRMWTRVQDVVAVYPDYGMAETEKGTLEHRYKKLGSKKLYEKGLIPEEYII